MFTKVARALAEHVEVGTVCFRSRAGIDRKPITDEQGLHHLVRDRKEKSQQPSLLSPMVF